MRGQFRLTEGAAALDALAALAGQPPLPDWAPVVAVPDVFEPGLCRKLIDLYEADGGADSGFMRDVDGMTKLLLDPRHKVRRDYMVEEPELARQLNLRIIHRLLPMVRRVFQYEATRVERLLVGCYEARTGGHFRAHRETPPGTAHRRFAVTSNLTPRNMRAATSPSPHMARAPLSRLPATRSSSPAPFSTGRCR